MSFLYPKFLWALLLILVPVIIHLFNFRPYKTVYFSNVEFLQQLKVNTQSRSRLKQWLLLLTRMLAILFLVLLFAGPLNKKQANQVLPEANNVAIYIDNSFSMEGVGERGLLFEQAKIKALEIIAAFPPSTQFLLSTNNPSAELGRFLNREDASNAIGRIKVSSIQKKLSEVLNYQHYMLSEKDSVSGSKVFLLSDFQQYMADFNELDLKDRHSYYLAGFENRQKQNILIDSVAFKTPGHYKGKQETIQVRVRNLGQQAYTDLPLQFFVNDTLRYKQNFSVDAEGFVWVELPYLQRTTGDISCRVELQDYPISFDNVFYFNFKMSKQVKVLSIYENKDYFAPLFRRDSNMLYVSKNRKQIDYSEFNKFNIIYINELEKVSDGFAEKLQQYVAQGGHLCILPAQSSSVNQYNKLFRLLQLPGISQWQIREGSLQQINYTSNLFDGVFSGPVEKPEPIKYKGYFQSQNKNLLGVEHIGKSVTESPLLLQKPLGKGKVFVSYLPIDKDNTNFSFHGLFVPIFYNLALHSVNFGDLYYTINPGVNVTLNVSDRTGLPKLKMENNTFSPKSTYINGQLNIYPDVNMLMAGTFKVEIDNEKKALVSFNFNRDESDLNYFSLEKLQNLPFAERDNVQFFDVNTLDISTKLINERRSQDKSYWLIFALLLSLLAEGLIVRIMP